MAHALGVTRSAMLLGRMRDPAPLAFAHMLERRLEDEPVAYIIGEAEFYGRRFAVTPDVLIPRGDSEAVIAAALDAAPAPSRILDLGTGSGCLLLTMLAECPGARGWGLDRSAEALMVADANAAALQLKERVRFLKVDWNQPGWAERLGAFDLILANPPYVEAEAELDASVRDFEPAGALFAGADGLDAYRCLIPQLPHLLADQGVAVVEIGHRQAAAVTAIAARAGFSVTVLQDLAGRDRALVMRINRLAKRG